VQAFHHRQAYNFDTAAYTFGFIARLLVALNPNDGCSFAYRTPDSRLEHRLASVIGPGRGHPLWALYLNVGYYLSTGLDHGYPFRALDSSVSYTPLDGLDSGRSYWTLGPGVGYP
jgi:hypothetical protein